MAQTTTTTPKSTTDNTFSMNGAISSLVLGMSPKSKTVDMTTVQKFILSGDWNMRVDKGKLANFAANFYTGPVNGGISNHTHQISNFRTDNNNTPIIQLSPTKTVSVIVNNVKPYQNTTAAGSGGAADYSKWNFVLTSKYTTIKPGQNKITSK